MSNYTQLNLFDIIDNKSSESQIFLNTENLNKKLIEIRLPARKISIEGTAERYSNSKTPHSIHVWWARRPISAMRSLIFASLVSINEQNNAQKLTEICHNVAQFDPDPHLAITQAKKMLNYDKTVIDLFGGGGTIAYANAQLGCKSISVELNPLATFVQKSLLIYSQKVPDLSLMIQDYGTKLLSELSKETRFLFPQNKNDQQIIAYFWARCIKCPECEQILPVKTVIPLQNKPNNQQWAIITPNVNKKLFDIQLISDHIPPQEKLEKCPFCQHEITKNDLKNHHPSMILPVAFCQQNNQGKTYHIYQEDHISLDELINTELNILKNELPQTELPQWSGITNPTLYGLIKHYDLFTKRQLLMLLKLINKLQQLYHKICEKHNIDIAKGIIALLSGLIDQLVDWNSSLTVWLPTNEQVGRALAGPGLPMQWNFVEIDPFNHGPANLWDKLNRIIKSAVIIPKFDQIPQVIFGSSTNINLPDQSVDAIITDPPYADNLYYSILADCIYTWKRLCLKDIFPDDFVLEKSPTDLEIVASKHRQGTSKEALNFYQEKLQSSLSEGYRLLKPDGILSFIFTHSTLTGWTSIFYAILGAKFKIVTAYPFCIERKARPSGMVKGAINASCVIVAVKQERDNLIIKNEDIELNLENLAGDLKSDNWSDQEIGLAVFIQRTSWYLIGVNYLEKIEDIVQKCYDQTHEQIPEFKLKLRQML